MTNASASGGDYRGSFGFGRAAHGSDAKGVYGFAPAAASVPTSIDEIFDLCTAPPCANISVKDLRFEANPLGLQNACMTVGVAAAHTGVSFDLTFALSDQSGDVGTTVMEARTRLIALFRSAIAELEARPLQLE